ncbi:MAG: SDR family oxidoreductase [Desulfobacteraceae bacterium]|nr:MAG: SDR family oxidoreductase [Desulfobacteraceae bacterium]
MNPDNKVALVLGSIKGIGKGIGIALAKEGFNVALNYFDWEDMLDELQKDLSKTDASCFITRTNLLKTEKIQEMINKIIGHFGRLDILINNIERGGWPIVHGPYTCDQWDLEVSTTLRAKQWVFEASLPHLKASGNGMVINLSSIAGVVGRSGPASYIFNEGYSAANRGISLLTETWARLGSPEVRVNEIMLGIIETRHGEKTRGWGLLTDDQKEAIIDHTLVKRTGTTDDVIKAVLFLIKDAPFMTGSILRLDGGYVLGGEKISPMPKGVL